MGLYDLFKHRKRGYYGDHGYYGGQQNYHHGHFGGINKYLYIYEKLKNNRRLLKFVIIAVILAVVLLSILAIILVIMLIPLLTKLFDAIQNNGLSGILETLKPWIELFWGGMEK